MQRKRRERMGASSSQLRERSQYVAGVRPCSHSRRWGRVAWACAMRAGKASKVEHQNPGICLRSLSGRLRPLASVHTASRYFVGPCGSAGVWGAPRPSAQPRASRCRKEESQRQPPAPRVGAASNRQSNHRRMIRQIMLCGSEGRKHDDLSMRFPHGHARDRQ